MSVLDRVNEALHNAYIDIADSAFHAGFIDKDHNFDTCCMSEAEWLKFAITGDGTRKTEVSARWILKNIDDLAAAMVDAVNSGTDPYEVTLGRVDI